ncbi:malto-oligosyltrehalose synthase [Aquincola sp. MAHUQ-54]|uniref:Malto-oligosyltrehalose synthase n=1 Tax=Aquincola agrisoli TaxID=3119538 RepID=A0AAW9QB29_9BURK
MTDRSITMPDAIIPRATYRLQLHKDFGFAQAAAVLPYLRRLGVSHVYCSPIWRARPGSLHGYDVVEPGTINPELGGDEGFERFAAAARAQGLGLLLDMVPNHMGVFGADNPWWLDVLENGQASRYAGHFDIDWSPPNRSLRGKLLVPVLGDSYGAVLDRGELQLGHRAGRLALHYHQHLFPLDPRSYAQVLQQVVEELPGGDAVRQMLQRLSKEFAALPAHDDPDEARRTQRQAAVPVLQAALADVSSAPAVQAAIDGTLKALNEAPARDALDALHDRQAYRLASWRVAADEINYRRFFDVNELAAIRVEVPEVFEATHGRALDLAAAGVVDGLRIDHPDGLLDPAQYFERLQAGYAQRRGEQRDPASRFGPLYVAAEKIAAAHEDVPHAWALHGTTGYRFANVVNGLFVERRHAARLERLWREHAQAPAGYEHIVREAKLAVARGALASDLTLLAQALHRVAQSHRSTRDHGFNTLREALAEVAASMPVYRTYVVETPSAQDRRFIEWAVADARRHSGIADDGVFEFVRRCLLRDPPPGLGGPAAEALLRRFVLRFQQFCAPVAAKGVEDTAFYRYHRLVSLNEVGGEPAVFGLSAAAFHGASVDRARHWPHTMLASSTHDNKRAEDVRQRINVLSEQPAALRLGLRRWREGTRAWRSDANGRPAPAPSDDYLLYQTLLGSLPAEPLTEEALAAYRERIQAYMLKAVREAKQYTSWVRPDAAYEAALQRFIHGVLGRLQPNPVLSELRARAGELAWYGALNSVSATVLKLTSPGVPDLYQGSELMPLTLVDPDNRQPVDYAVRERLLEGFEQAATQGLPAADTLAALARTPADGRLKLWCLWRLLHLRAELPALLRDGNYQPLRVQGRQRAHAIAFARCVKGATLLVIAGRKFAQAFEAGQWPVGEAAWSGTSIAWPNAMAPRLAGGPEAVDALTGRSVALAAEGLPLGAALADLPVAVLLLRTRGADNGNGNG